MFNNDPRVTRLVLKPCCLPGAQHLRDEVFYKIGTHTFSAKDVYDAKEQRSQKSMLPNANRGQRNGESRFNSWCSQLAQGVTRTKGVSVDTQHVRVQTTHFQNKFIFAERPWTGFRADFTEQERTAGEMRVVSDPKGKKHAQPNKQSPMSKVKPMSSPVKPGLRA